MLPFGVLPRVSLSAGNLLKFKRPGDSRQLLRPFGRLVRPFSFQLRVCGAVIAIQKSGDFRCKSTGGAPLVTLYDPLRGFIVPSTLSWSLLIAAWACGDPCLPLDRLRCRQARVVCCLGFVSSLKCPVSPHPITPNSCARYVCTLCGPRTLSGPLLVYSKPSLSSFLPPFTPIASEHSFSLPPSHLPKHPFR
jgi:hypothetical protein